MLVATAGHVDHGKTSLIHHLTGVHTDRLAEEKRRGLTIELGYAFIKDEADNDIGVIDVPGHHRFINTMISGINGIDLGLLVVAADDGPMPQTLEHLQLLRLLGVEHFAGVVSKSDLVDADRLQQVTEETRALIPGAPVCQVSNRTGDGLGALRAILDVQSRNCPQRATESLFRLYIDRVFIKKGAGVVVSGTCLSGSVSVGDELQLHASVGNDARIRKVRVREVHAQGQSAVAGFAGQRCALNIAGKIALEDVHRGDFLCAHATALPARRIDTRCWTLAGNARSLKHLGRVKLYIGTRRVAARTYFLEHCEGSAASQRIQLILDGALLAFAGDRFILRDEHESTTLGGGVVIDPEAPQWGKSRSGRLKQLDALENRRPAAALHQLLFGNKALVSLRQCERIWNLSPVEINDVPTTAMDPGSFVRIRYEGDELVLSYREWQQYIAAVETQLAQWHRARPMEPGISPESLQALIHRNIPAQAFRSVLEHLIREGHIVYHEQWVHAAGHKPTLSPQVQQGWLQLENHMTRRGSNIPLRSELQKDTGFDAKQLEALTRPAIKAGNLFEIGEKRLALPGTLRELAGRLALFVDASGGISVIEAKQVFGLGRNLTIEILEFFDHIGYTRRDGDKRAILHRSAAQLGNKRAWRHR